ncbi:MAG TPA: FliG C-terminal domain-containing protein [Planctomycetota bacterium]|nr:FliG C-terminal domain-containing protein [Planctomycetota bacterium]
MKCVRCPSSAEGYAVIPGGGAGEIRFYCAGCATSDRVRMRYWDARELRPADSSATAGSIDFTSLVFDFDDLARMRLEDLKTLLEWVDDGDLAAAMAGTPEVFRRTVFAAMKRPQAESVRAMLREGPPKDVDPVAARRRIAETVKKL